MGKRSVRENKNIYQLSREAKGLTREAASELLTFMSPERIEKIESEKSFPHPGSSFCYLFLYSTSSGSAPFPP